MKLNFECLSCNMTQVLKITDILELDRDKKEAIVREVLGYLQATDYNRSNPEVIRGTWDIITKRINNHDPYKDIKEGYNYQVLEKSGEINDIISSSKSKFNTALKVAIAGNMIDFAANHEFDIEILLDKIAKIEDETLGKDDSSMLFENLKTAKQLLYLGDNCGEIVLDRIFIETIREYFPDLEIYYGVRGKNIINDVTMTDALQVDMMSVAKVIDNGDGSLGTIIERVSKEFLEKFNEADVIISKGQGNFESLSEVKKQNLYFLFMAKCNLVADALGVSELSIVCARHGNE